MILLHKVIEGSETKIATEGTGGEELPEVWVTGREKSGN